MRRGSEWLFESESLHSSAGRASLAVLLLGCAHYSHLAEILLISSRAVHSGAWKPSRS